MFISKIHLPRRTVLKALGATVGLPLLEAMIPAATALARTAAAPRPCMSFIYFPHGAVMDQWTPQLTPQGATAETATSEVRARGFELPPILAPLASARSSLTIVSGLENKAARAAPVHAITAASWLSCSVPQVGTEAKAGVTVDQLAARKWGGETRFESLQLAAQSAVPSCYPQTLSFREPTVPLPMEHDPRRVFARLFGEPRGAGRSGSVLDLVRQDAARLSRTMGPRDRATLNDHLARVRAVEMRVHAVQDESTAFDVRVRLMFDLLALAYQANLTRVATFMMAAEASEQSYDFAGVAEPFHALSHHGNNTGKLERLVRVQTANSALFAEFVGKLGATADGDGSLLDHSLIVYGSNMSNSNLHDHANLPIALLGGRLAGGRHISCQPHTPLANLYVALLNKADVPTRSFADSTAELALT